MQRTIKGKIPILTIFPKFQFILERQLTILNSFLMSFQTFVFLFIYIYTHIKIYGIVFVAFI